MAPTAAPPRGGKGGTSMDRKDLYMGLGLGFAACGLGTALLRPRKSRRIKSSVGKTLRTMSELADSVCDAIGR